MLPRRSYHTFPKTHPGACAPSQASSCLLETQLSLAASAQAAAGCRQEEGENAGEVRKETNLGSTSHQLFLSSPSYSCSSRAFFSLWTRTKGRMKYKLLVGGHCIF